MTVWILSKNTLQTLRLKFVYHKSRHIQSLWKKLNVRPQKDVKVSKYKKEPSCARVLNNDNNNSTVTLCHPVLTAGMVSGGECIYSGSKIQDKKKIWVCPISNFPVTQDVIWSHLGLEEGKTLIQVTFNKLLLQLLLKDTMCSSKLRM